jgi:spore maturation protein CgeB
MTILCLCREEHHWKLIPGYAEAFRRRGIEFRCAEDAIPFDASLDEVVRRSGVTPSAIFHFESAHPLFPIGLEKSSIPTVCFHPDTYAFTERRIRWSSVFDHVVVFHPGFVERFAKAGHPGALLLPHAVRHEYFDGPELTREFEVAWVGQTGGPFYQARAEWLPKLARGFRTNDWSRPYTVQEVAETYRRSRIVVNIGRDDFPQDANLRVFEVLAAGALLLTSLPSELEQLGFHEGEHFVGYRDHREINGLVRRFLDDEPARRGIATAARELVLREHTYDRRVEQLLSRLEEKPERRQAPARFWPDARARLVAMDFYAAHGLTQCAATQFRRIAGRGFRETIEAASLLSRASLRSLRGG